jgi:hypothetical protein
VVVLCQVPSSASSASGGVKPASSSPPAAAPAAVVSPPIPNSGSTSTSAELMAAVEPDDGRDESLVDDFWWYGDDDGADYKPNGLVSNYILLCFQVSSKSVPPLASHVGLVMCGLSSDSATLGDDIVLPPDLVSSLLRAISPADLHHLVVGDTGATNHMLLDRSAFISNKSVWHLCICMGNNSYAPVLGQGTAIISLNGQRLLIRNVLHVPALRVPLYSLCAHFCQRVCSFVGSFDTGMHVYFPGVVLSVDMSTDCHLSYKPLGKSAPLSSLHYDQPWCPPVHYPAKSSAFHARTGADLSPKLHLLDDPVLVEDDGSTAHGACDVNNGLHPSTDDMAMDPPKFISPVPKEVHWARSKTFLADDLALIPRHLQFLSDQLSGLPVPPPPPSDLDPVAPKLLLSLSHD